MILIQDNPIFEEYTNYVIKGELKKAISLIYDLVDKGYSAIYYFKITNLDIYVSFLIIFLL